MFFSKTWDFTSYHPGKPHHCFSNIFANLGGNKTKAQNGQHASPETILTPNNRTLGRNRKPWFFFRSFFFGGLVWFQEISNRTHWTDPSTWVSNSSSNLLRGPLVRSHSIFDGLVHLLFFFLTAVFWEHNSEETHSRHSLTATLGLPCDAESLGISSTSDVMSRWRWRRMTADDLQKANNEDRDPSDMNERGGNETLGGGSKKRGTPKSSILIRFSIINHPFWGTLFFPNIQVVATQILFYFHPDFLGFHDPIWRSHIFQMGCWKTTKQNLMLNCQWCHFQRIFVWEIGNTLTCLEDLDLKNWCHLGRWVIEQVIPKKKQRFVFERVSFWIYVKFRIRAFHFFFVKNHVPDHWSFDKRHRVFGVRKNSQFHRSSVFHRKSRSLRGSRVGTPSVEGAPFPSRSTEAVGDQPQSETTTWRGGWENPSGRDATQVVMKNGETKQMKQSVPPVCEEKEQDWRGDLSVFFVCLFIFQVIYLNKV